jgi:hypothetical protein
LACLIDYRGFRLIAVAKLPINKETLIIGSNDSGSTILNSDPEIAQQMQKLAKILNLKGHRAESANSSTFLWQCFDLEVHRGLDNRVYLLDFHRTYPPEPFFTDNLTNPHLYRMLRPELVRNWSSPLSSDAFSRLDRDENNRAEVIQCYNSLIGQIIPNFARELDKIENIERIDELSEFQEKEMQATIEEEKLNQGNNGPNLAEASNLKPKINRNHENSDGKKPQSRVVVSADRLSSLPVHSSLSQLISYLHQRGINVRYLGLVRSHLSQEHWRSYLLLEIIARTLKNEFREQCRARMKEIQYISDSPFRRIAIEFINLVFHNSAESQNYWNSTLKSLINSKFQSGLSSAELNPKFDLKGKVVAQAINKQNLLETIFFRFIYLAGIVLQEGINNVDSGMNQGLSRAQTQPWNKVASGQNSAQPSQFTFYEHKMEDLHLHDCIERVKQVNIISYAEGSALLCKCTVNRTSDFNDYLSSLAVAKFREALRYSLDDYLSLCNFSMLHSIVFSDYAQGKLFLLRALHSNPYHQRSWYYLALNYHYHENKPRVAQYCYERALQLNPRHANSLKDYGNLLQHSFKDKEGAIRQYQLAVAAQPSHIKALSALASLLAKQAHSIPDYDEVIDLLRAAAYSTYADGKSRYKAQTKFLKFATIRAEVHAAQGEIDKAQQLFNEIVNYIPPISSFQAKSEKFSGNAIIPEPEVYYSAAMFAQRYLNDKNLAAAQLEKAVKAALEVQQTLKVTNSEPETVNSSRRSSINSAIPLNSPFLASSSTDSALIKSSPQLFSNKTAPPRSNSCALQKPSNSPQREINTKYIRVYADLLVERGEIGLAKTHYELAVSLCAEGTVGNDNKVALGNFLARTEQNSAKSTELFNSALAGTVSAKGLAIYSNFLREVERNDEKAAQIEERIAANKELQAAQHSHSTHCRWFTEITPFECICFDVFTGNLVKKLWLKIANNNNNNNYHIAKNKIIQANQSNLMNSTNAASSSAGNNTISNPLPSNENNSKNHSSTNIPSYSNIASKASGIKIPTINIKSAASSPPPAPLIRSISLQSPVQQQQQDPVSSNNPSPPSLLSFRVPSIPSSSSPHLPPQNDSKTNNDNTSTDSSNTSDSNANNKVSLSRPNSWAAIVRSTSLPKNS